MMIKLAKVSLTLIFAVIYSGFAQELPPIQIFTPQDYNAEDQNWSISQADNNYIYVANNSGLLEYNGANWTLYETPNKSIVRSVKVIENKIYTGFYRDFGYWTKDFFGVLHYTSLTEKFNIDVLEDEEFWNIFNLDQWLVFQSLDRIYVCDFSSNTVNTIGSDVRISKMFQVNDNVYFQQLNRGLFKIVNGKEVLVSNDPVILNHLITSIFSHNEGLLIQTKENGFYTFNNDSFYEWNTSLSEILVNNSIYSSIKLRDGSFILGTVSNGLMHVDSSGDLKFQVNQSRGLSNNTVLSLFEDKLGNIWVALDNGINVINLDSPFKEFIDNLGRLGTVYTAAIHNGYLYLGTNQGLFYKPLNAEINFKAVEGTNGQVWNLKVIDDVLFCSHDKGTFIIDKTLAENIFRLEGTWKLTSIPGRNNLLLQGNYDGLHILEKSSAGLWEYRNKIEGFNMSSRYFEFFENQKLLVSHEYKGVYQLEFDDGYSKVKSFSNVDINSGIKSSLISYNDQVTYAFEEGVFNFNASSQSFEKDSILSRFYRKNSYLSGKLDTDNLNNRLWIFSENSIGYIQPAGLTNQVKLIEIELPAAIRKSKPGFENILPLNSNSYLMGTTKGYVVIDINKVETKSYQIDINQIVNYKLNETKQFLALNKDTLLPVKSNNIKFSFSSPNYNKFLPTQYSYKLEGFNQDWSAWSKDAEVLYENLPYGSYTFMVQSKIGDHVSENTASYEFQIRKPWHLSNISIIFYIIGLVLLIILMHNFYKSYYKKQRNNILKQKENELEIKELENQKQLMQFRNKSLLQDVENKNRELGISTMNLIKKNELLSDIKSEITSANKPEDLKGVLKLINKNINNTDDWRVFEEAFNNADKDFLKKIKSIHPNLTSNDLKICAYLRLNLTSKEIAPLLNISTKSVEVKRYRLRKKMDLDRDINLTNYILDL